MYPLSFGFRAHDVTLSEQPADTDPFEQLAYSLEQHHVSCVQLAPLKSFPHFFQSTTINPGVVQRCKTAFDNHYIRIGVLGSYINMIHPNLEERNQLLHQFELFIRYAHILGAPMVASETGSVHAVAGGYTERNFNQDAYLQTICSIRQLVRVAEQCNVYVAIEPGVNHPIHNAVTIEHMLNDIASPNLGLIIDPTALTPPDHVNAQWQVELTQLLFEQFSASILAMHIADWKPTDTSHSSNRLIRCNATEGQMNIPAILNIAAQHKPYLTTIFEHTVDTAIDHVLEYF